MMSPIERSAPSANQASAPAEHHLLGATPVDAEEASDYMSRDDVLRLLGDGELAGALPNGLKNGDEYLDLDQLAIGVQRAGGSTAKTRNLLARKSVHERFWQHLTQLAAAPQ